MKDSYLPTGNLNKNKTEDPSVQYARKGNVLRNPKILKGNLRIIKNPKEL